LAVEFTVIPSAPMVRVLDVLLPDLIVVVPVLPKVIPEIAVSDPKLMVSEPFIPLPLKTTESILVGAEAGFTDPIYDVHQLVLVDQEPVPLGLFHQ